jgi:predicted HTH domain antitoxin
VARFTIAGSGWRLAAVSVIIDIPVETEKILRAEWGDLSRAASEALLIESYRQGKLSLGQCSEIFGKTIAETEAFFRSRGVDLPITPDDVRDDIAYLERILK